MCESHYSQFAELFAPYGIMISVLKEGFVVIHDHEFDQFLEKLFWTRKCQLMKQNEEQEKFPATFRVCERKLCENVAQWIELCSLEYDLLNENVYFTLICNALQNGLVVSERYLKNESKKELYLMTKTILEIYMIINKIK